MFLQGDTPMQQQDILIWVIAGSAIVGALGLMATTAGGPIFPEWLRSLFSSGKEAAKKIFSEGQEWPADKGPPAEVQAYLAAIRQATAGKATPEFLLQCAAEKLSPAQAATEYIRGKCTGGTTEPEASVATTAPARRTAGGRK